MSGFYYKNLYHFLVRESLKDLNKQYEKSENDLKALQSVGQIVGEVLKQLTEDNCMFNVTYIVSRGNLTISFLNSYCKSYKWSTICCRV